MIRFLKIVFTLLLLGICYQVIRTSLESNLFDAWSFLGSIPWMRATLWDFYTNVAVLCCWIAYKERRWWMAALWLVLLVTLGSIATCTYMLIQLFRLKPGEGLAELFGKRTPQ